MSDGTITTTAAEAPAASASEGTKIAKIMISDYRAFPSRPDDYVFDFGAQGKNLLLYGENGSGKSSLFHALCDLAALPSDTATFADYRYIFAPSEEGHITVKFTDVIPGDFEWEYGEKHPSETGGQPYTSWAERCRFLDYKALLETNFVHRTPSPNLFTLLVTEVLRDLPVISKGKQDRLGAVYKRMESTKPPNRRGKRHLSNVDNACTEFSKVLSNHLPDVVKEGQRLLGKMGYEGMSFDLTPSTVKYDRIERNFTGQQIGLSVTLFGKSIDHPQLFLNEARLTALALAIYLGAAKHVLRSPSPGPDRTVMARLLVLDDILIGLDLANRLPVLKVLNEDFSDWQVVLMTYDRLWFELAKAHTEQSGQWVYLSLRELSTVSGKPGIPQIHPCKDLLSIAGEHLRVDDLMAAAVYIRAAFETRLKNVCEKHGIKVNYKPDPKDLKAEQLWEGIVERQKERQAKGQDEFIGQALLEDVATIRSTVLNRLSHSDAPALVKNEVQFALETVKKLRDHKFKRLDEHAIP